MLMIVIKNTIFMINKVLITLFYGLDFELATVEKIN